MKTLLTALLVLLTVAGSAFAEWGETKIPWIGLTGRLASYKMDDVNAQIREVDKELEGEFNEITSGFAFGGAIGLEITPKIDIAFNYERLLAKSSVQETIKGELETDLPGDAIFGTVEYKTTLRGNVTGGAGIGLGWIRTSGKILKVVTGSGVSEENIEGSGALFDGYLVCDLPVNEQITFAPVLGYRYAVSKNVKSNGRPVVSEDGSEITIDYSGVFVGLKFRFRFGTIGPH